MNLPGSRIVITRPRAQAQLVGHRISELGGMPVYLPVLRIEPPLAADNLSSAMERLDDFDWVVLTSVNAARAVVVALRSAARRPRIAAVGPVTAEFVQQAGMTVTAMPARHQASEIPHALGDIAGCAILLPRGDAAEAGLERALTGAGARVEKVLAYRTVPVAEVSPALRRECADASAVLFMSGSAVHAFHSLGVDAGGALIACIGPSTAEAARSRGYVVDVVPDHFTGRALVDAVATRLQRTEEVGS